MNHALCGLAANPALPPELVDRLIAVADDGIAAELAGRADLSRAQAVALASRVEESAGRLANEGRLTAADIDPTAQPEGALALLRERAGNPEWARLFATDPVVGRREELAACPGLPSDVVEIRDALATDADARVVGAVAAHPGLAEARLRAMADRYGAQVVGAVAANPEATPGLLEDLARREPPVRKVLREVAGHRNATAPALLACLGDARARRVAAGHPALPPPVIVGLLADADRQVVEAAAANPSLPVAVMSQLVS
ncbi:hypothetical protein ACWD01_31690 [Streptomyces sp. NPDC002835]